MTTPGSNIKTTGEPTARTPMKLGDVDRTLSHTLKQHWYRIKAGDVGMLPVILGLVLIAFVFQFLNGNFLTTQNLVNLISQSSIYILIAIGTVIVLTVAEVDLSVGFVAGIAGVVAAHSLNADYHIGLSILLGLLAGALAGFIQGAIITWLNLPSFVVTLGGQLAYMGVMLLILGSGGTLPINSEGFSLIANGIVSTNVGWVFALVIVVLYGGILLLEKRRLNGLNRPSPSWALLAVKVGGLMGCLSLLMVLFSADRGRVTTVTGVPVVVLVVAGAIGLGTFVFERMKFGRYVRAVGGNPEAARRAGIAVKRTRLYVFVISGLTAGMGGLMLASRLRSVSTSLEGGQLVLYCIAAAVIGGTSMYGGRGKIIHALLGGLIVAGVDNGMGLLGVSAAVKFIVTGFVLLVAVSIDAIARRNRSVVGLA